MNVYDIKGNNYISIVTKTEPADYKIQVFSLPTSTEGILEDVRFSNKTYRYIAFVNFYDKVLFEAVKSGSEERDTDAGFFDLEGIIQLINKIKVSLNIFDT